MSFVGTGVALPKATWAMLRAFGCAPCGDGNPAGNCPLLGNAADDIPHRGARHRASLAGRIDTMRPQPGNVEK